MLLEDTGFAYNSHIYLTRVTREIFQHLISFGLTEFHTTPHSILSKQHTRWAITLQMDHFWSNLFEFVVIKICLILSPAVNIILGSDNFQMWLSLKKNIHS